MSTGLNDKRLLKSIAVAGAVVSVLIAAGTTGVYLANGGKNPARLLNFVASGIYGPAAFQGDEYNALRMAVLGALMHSFISMGWALLFFVLATKVTAISPMLIKKWWLVGTLYGIAIWAGMVFVVLPLSKTPPKPFDAAEAVIDIVLIVVCAGLPISFIAKKYKSQT